MIYSTRFYVIFLGLLSLCNIQAQQTFVKSFKVFNKQFEFGNSLQLDSTSIFIASRGSCNGEACSVISKLEMDGELSQVSNFEGLYGGNNNTILLDSTSLIHATYSYPKQSFHYIKLNKKDCEILNKEDFELDSISKDRLNVDGLIKYNSQYCIFGEYLCNKTVNALQDLQEDGYGNLVFVTVYIDQNFDNSSVIRKLDRNGKIINDVYIPSVNSLEPRPQLCVNKQKQYIFSHSVDRINDLIEVVQIVCTDTSGGVLWVHNYPWKIIGQQPINWSNNYKIRQITSTSDGGVIVTATIRTNRIQNRFYDDAYVGKFDSFGTLEWERRINILDDRDTLYDYCALYDIKERPDGLGYIAVGSHTPSDNLQTTNILLVSLDRDGCIEGLTCDDNHLVVSTDDVVDVKAHHDQPKINPNPFSDILNVESGGSKRIRIFDINGNIIVDQKTELGITSFETTTWNTSMYIINLISSNGNMKSYKIVKK